VVSNNLEDIKGVGPKTLSVLKEANILTIKQLSELTVNELEHLDGIGSTKAEQFISEAKRKLGKSHTSKNSETIEGDQQINHSIIQELQENIEKMNSRVERLDMKVGRFEKNTYNSEKTNQNKGDIQLFNQSSIIDQLKRELINHLKDPAFYESIFKNGIRTYFQDQQKVLEKSQKRQSAKILALKEQIKALQQQISSLEEQICPEKLIETNEKDIPVKDDNKEIDIVKKTQEPLETQKATKNPKNPTMDEKLILNSQKSYDKPIRDLKDIETYIKYILQKGDSIQIDRLIKRRELQNISLTQLKQAIYTLIDKNVVAPAKSSISVQKIDGNIGKLTRIN